MTTIPTTWLASHRKVNLNEPAMPRKIVNLAAAGVRTAGAIAHRERILVSTEEQARRLAVCAICEFFTGTACKKCGCHIRFKTKLATEHCPVGKW